jgi:hypothetical protein
VCGNTGPFGTLGCLASSDGQDRWLLTAYHVLAGFSGTLRENDPVFQPAQGGPQFPIARVRQAKASRTLDAAAALLVDEAGDGLEATNEILGVGALGPISEPLVDMRVVKSGIASGVTEGVIVDVANERIKIEVPRGYPSKYELSSISDSGAIWLEQATRSPVALHIGGSDTGVEVALGIRLSEILTRLGLQLLG